MSDSIRDQLLALGLAKPKPKAETRETERRRPGKGGAAPRREQQPRNDGATRSHGGGAKEFDLAKAYAIRAQTERDEREQIRREAEARARENKERKLRLQQLLAGKGLNAADADVARHFPHGSKIRRIYVTADQLVALNRGELGVVQLAGRYLLVAREVALAAQAISADALVLLPDPDAPADDDVPPDLVW
jgi:uncharacterized protein YaiL (DUF2058 family)